MCQFSLLGWPPAVGRGGHVLVRFFLFTYG